MRAITKTVSEVGVSAPIPLDTYLTPFSVGLAVVISAGGGLTYTVEHTFDDVFAKGYVPAAGTWFPHASLAALTATSNGNYAFPITAARLNVTAYTSGSATFTALQAGIGA